MSGDGTPSPPRSRLLTTQRLLGVDLARGFALFGMMSVHIFPALTADGSVTWAFRIAAGRASALFAVLAGLSLVLATGTATARSAGRGVRAGVLARAGFIAGVGLFLGLLGSGIAIILVHYAVLFAIGSLFLRAGARALLVAGVTWLAVSPVASHLVRPLVPAGPGASPSVASLANPLELLVTVVLTGYYPVLQWTGYVLVGMGLAKLPLRRAGVASTLLLAGTLLAVGTKLLSHSLLRPAARLQELSDGAPTRTVEELATLLQTGLHGTTPVKSWWWLAVSAPHAGTPLDLLHTAATAVGVLGACLLVVSISSAAGLRAFVLPIAAAGSMTLTLYTLHVTGLALVRGVAPSYPDDSPETFWALNVAVATLLATAWQWTGRRGPLETVANDLSRAARLSRVRPPPASPSPTTAPRVVDGE